MHPCSTDNSQLRESLSFLSGPMMKTARIVRGRSELSLLEGSSMPSAAKRTSQTINR